MHHMGLQHGKRHLVLGENVRHGEFSAESVPPVGEVHLPDFVRIGLHQDGHPRILQGCDGSVFVRKDGH